MQRQEEAKKERDSRPLIAPSQQDPAPPHPPPTPSASGGWMPSLGLGGFLRGGGKGQQADGSSATTPES